SERTFIENTIKKSIFLINSSNISQLLQLKKKYKIARLYDLRAYLRKIDIIPPSLALAQASLESGWGKSRFAKEANNLFGQWTYTGNGMVPENREEGKIHTIRIFRDLEDSVENYMLNLNIGWAYTDFRQKRYELRQKNETLDGYLLSETLLEYSSAGQAYVDDLKTMIDTNGFRRYDYLIKQQSQKGLI
ncbi:MAG: glucosaminidase domain-containing protein, partial [Arcobacteraceae bacterium]